MRVTGETKLRMIRAWCIPVCNKTQFSAPRNTGIMPHPRQQSLRSAFPRKVAGQRQSMNVKPESALTLCLSWWNLDSRVSPGPTGSSQKKETS